MLEQFSHHSSTKGIVLSPLPRSQGDYHLNPDQKRKKYWTVSLRFQKSCDKYLFHLLLPGKERTSQIRIWLSYPRVFLKICSGEPRIPFITYCPAHNTCNLRHVTELTFAVSEVCIPHCYSGHQFRWQIIKSRVRLWTTTQDNTSHVVRLSRFCLY